jgi:hypothetical protein
MIYTAQITEIDKVLDGSPVFTAVNAAGAVMFPCYLMSAAGGYQAAFSTPPLRVGAVVVLVRPDDNEPFYIVGGVPAPADQAAVSLEGATAGAAADYRGHALDETVMRNTNSTFTLSPRNNAVLNSPSIKLQLQGGGLRVSQQGTASNGVLNADPFIDTLFTYLNEIVTRVGVIERTVTALYNGQEADLTVEAAEISARVSAGTATPADLDRLAELTQLVIDVQTIQVPLTPSNVVQSQAETAINDHIRIP